MKSILFLSLFIWFTVLTGCVMHTYEHEDGRTTNFYVWNEAEIGKVRIKDTSGYSFSLDTVSNKTTYEHVTNIVPEAAELLLNK